MIRLTPLALVPVACGSELTRTDKQVDDESVARQRLPESGLLAPRLAAARGLPKSRASFELAGDRITPKGDRPSRARVSLGRAADQPFELSHRASGVSMSVALIGAQAARAEAALGYLVYPKGYAGVADVLFRPTAGGLEDYVLFDSPPAEPRVSYEISLSESVAGLRLVEGVLELLDVDGAPRLRLSNAHVVDSGGQRHVAQIAVTGCAYDESPVAPWRRPVTPPGARTCVVETSWSSEVSYPAVLDPSWSVTDQLSTGRHSASQARLPDGTILFAGGVLDFQAGGGCSGSYIKTAEVFDPVTETWAATGSLLYAHSDQDAALLSDGTVLIAGGASWAPPVPPTNREAERYDPETGQFSSAGTPSAQHNRGALSALADGGAILVAGHVSNAASSASERFTPPSTWTAAASLDAPRGNPTALTLSNGKVLVVGGSDNSNQPLASADLYDPDLDDFTATDAMSFADYRFSAFEMAGEAILIAKTGGAEVQRFDIESEQFSDGALAPFGGDATRIPGGALLVNPASQATSVYDQATNSWLAVGATNWTPVRNYPLLLAIDEGRVLIAGGSALSASSLQCTMAESEILRLTALGEACTVGAECASGYCEGSLCAVLPDDGEGGAGGQSGTGGANEGGNANEGGMPGEGGNANEGGTPGEGGAASGGSAGTGATGAGGVPNSTGSGGTPNPTGSGGTAAGNGGTRSGDGGDPGEGGSGEPSGGSAGAPGGSGGGAPKSASSDDDGCGCRVGASPNQRPVSVALFGLAWAWLARRRRGARRVSAAPDSAP